MRSPRTRWPRELLAVLAIAPPILGLVFEPDGMRHELAHQARSLLAIWIYVMCLGLGIQVTTDRVRARWPSSLAGAIGSLRHVAIAAAAIASITGALAYPLVWTCPGLDGRIPTLLLRGLLLGTVYVLLGRLYESFLATREEAAAARARADRDLSEARYAALVSRTQPHFLHNALATAAGLLPRDPDAAERILRDLGSLFREVVQGTEQRAVRAADELETARRYLRVQELRFSPRLQVTIDADPLAAEELVPPLVLLPFVENAVLHGIGVDGATIGDQDANIVGNGKTVGNTVGNAVGNTVGNTVRVRVGLALERDHVVFTVEDDGPGLGGSRHRGAGVGARDVEERLTTLFGERASITRRAARPAELRPGLIVELRLPREDG